MMTKISRLLICVVLMAMLACTASAADISATATPDKTNVKAGDSVTITVSVDELQDCKRGSIRLTYDTAVFERGSSSWLLENLTLNDPSGDAVFAYASPTAVSGNIYQFTLKVKEGVTVSSSRIDVKVTLNDSTANVSLSLDITRIHAYDNDCDTTCNHCGEKREVTHAYDDGVVTTEATCAAEGVKTKTCTGCGATETEAIPVKDHTYDGGVVTTEATCTAPGVKTCTCTVCGATTTEDIPAKDHTYDNGVVTKEPTCKAKGVKTYTCTGCGETKTEKLSKLKHSYDEGTTTTEMTCTQDGVITYTCSLCGGTKTETLTAPGHSYDHECDPDCNTCGETRETEHEYSDRWRADENGHWHACEICADVQEVLAHNPGPEPTEDTDQICLDCGFVLLPAGTHIHAENGDWLSDEENHWHLCECGEILDPQAHAWDEGTLDEAGSVMTYHCTVCGTPRTETVEQPTESVPPTEQTQPGTAEPETTAPVQTEPTAGNAQDQPAAEMPWWIVILAVGVLLIAAVIFIIVGILKSKKQTGKYSG